MMSQIDFTKDERDWVEASALGDLVPIGFCCFLARGMLSVPQRLGRGDELGAFQFLRIVPVQPVVPVRRRQV